jgi:hypothetical protein
MYIFIKIEIGESEKWILLFNKLSQSLVTHDSFWKSSVHHWFIPVAFLSLFNCSNLSKSFIENFWIEKCTMTIQWSNPMFQIHSTEKTCLGWIFLIQLQLNKRISIRIIMINLLIRPFLDSSSGSLFLRRKAKKRRRIFNLLCKIFTRNKKWDFVSELVPLFYLFNLPKL